MKKNKKRCRICRSERKNIKHLMKECKRLKKNRESIDKRGTESKV